MARKLSTNTINKFKKKLLAEQVETLSKAKISRDILTSQSKVK